MVPEILTERASAANVTTSGSIFRHLQHRFRVSDVEDSCGRAADPHSRAFSLASGTVELLFLGITTTVLGLSVLGRGSGSFFRALSVGFWALAFSRIGLP